MSAASYPSSYLHAVLTEISRPLAHTGVLPMSVALQQMISTTALVQLHACRSHFGSQFSSWLHRMYHPISSAGSLTLLEQLWEFLWLLWNPYKVGLIKT